MRHFLLIVLLATYTLSFAKWVNPPFDNYFPTVEIPMAISAEVEYKNIYETPQEKKFVIDYNWSDDQRMVSYKYLDSTYTVEFDDHGNIIHWKQEYLANYQSTAIDEYYIYDEYDRVIERYSPDSARQYFYYSDDNVTTIEFWHYESVFKEWVKVEKMEFEYYEGGYDSKLFTYNYETQDYIYRRTTRYTVNENGRVILFKDIDSTAGQIYQFTFGENEYQKQISWYGSDHASFMYEYFYNEQGDLDHYIYSEWSGSYWKPCITEQYKYEYIDSYLEEIISDSELKYRYFDINGLPATNHIGLKIRIDNKGHAEKLLLK